jgi:hypothetical protein
MNASGTYFVQVGTDGPIKIGQTIDVQKRLSMLQTGNHEEMRLLLVLPDRSAERELHRRFTSCRLRGEWFKPAPELLSFIRDSAKQEIAFPGFVPPPRDPQVEQEKAAGLTDGIFEVAKQIQRLGLGGLQPGPLEFIGMQMRDQGEAFASGLQAIASALESVAEALRGKNE